ncbi:hypothetical protein JCM8097_009305 [Rhodosporidiobolus ruineniae]
MGALCSQGTADPDAAPSPPASSSSSPPPADEVLLAPFPLLDLPQEVILSIVDALDAWQKKRDLRAFRALLVEGKKSGRMPPVVQLSLDKPIPGDEDALSQYEGEETALLEVIELLSQSTLQVLFVHQVILHAPLWQRLLDAIAASSTLSALRFNQVDYGWPAGVVIHSSRDRVIPTAPLPHIRTLQIMHSASALELVENCTQLDSLLLWPNNRRLGPYMEHIKTLLPNLRLLSLDSVREAAAFRVFAEEVLALPHRLSETGHTLPLEELFLEGPMTAADLPVLLAALPHLPSLQRLALYQLRDPTPAFFHELVGAVHGLRALTIVTGDCEEAKVWPAPLEAYLPHLRRLPHLRFYASDRKALLLEADEGTRSGARREAQKRAEFEAMRVLKGACKRLREAVAITRDVSGGSRGYFARFYTNAAGKQCISLQQRTAHDFLIGYERWVRVKED